MTRRERWSILGDVLAAIDDEAQRHGEARVTALTMLANLPHDRLVGYLRELEAAGLVTAAARPALTSQGRVFLRQYREWLGVLARFGLEPGHDGGRGGVPAPDAGSSRTTGSR